MADDEIVSVELVVSPEQEVAALRLFLAELVPVVDELCAWVDTNSAGCVEVMERGEAALLRLRKVVGDV